MERRSAPHFLQLELRANCQSPQLGQVQSETSGVDGELPHRAVFEVPHLEQADLEAKTKPLHPGHVQSPDRGLEVPHLLQADFEAKTRPLHPGHVQSPGLPPGPGAAGVVAAPFQLAPHFRQVLLLAKT
mmetsp:Transcript_58266/g.107305  ORF Transcript_58266/g.107305 Transcript_58266/m.107305 type:complete len:129 (-) Transcript_58266:33-419(-)